MTYIHIIMIKMLIGAYELIDYIGCGKIFVGKLNTIKKKHLFLC